MYFELNVNHWWNNLTVYFQTELLYLEEFAASLRGYFSFTWADWGWQVWPEARPRAQGDKSLTTRAHQHACARAVTSSQTQEALRRNSIYLLLHESLWIFQSPVIRNYIYFRSKSGRDGRLETTWLLWSHNLRHLVKAQDMRQTHVSEGVYIQSKWKYKNGPNIQSLTECFRNHFFLYMLFFHWPTLIDGLKFVHDRNETFVP